MCGGEGGLGSGDSVAARAWVGRLCPPSQDSDQRSRFQRTVSLCCVGLDGVTAWGVVCRQEGGVEGRGREEAARQQGGGLPARMKEVRGEGEGQ